MATAKRNGSDVVLLTILHGTGRDGVIKELTEAGVDAKKIYIEEQSKPTLLDF